MSLLLIARVVLLKLVPGRTRCRFPLRAGVTLVPSCPLTARYGAISDHTSSTPPRILPAHSQNRYGTLHGAALLTLADTFGAIVLLTISGGRCVLLLH